jgi:hypothetical protein
VNRHDPLGLWWWDGDNIEYGILPLFGFTKGGQTVGDAWGALGEGYHQGAVNVVTAPYRLGNYAGEQGIAAYDLGKETGSSDFEALRLATGVTVTRVTGALDLIEATVGGQKIVGDSDSGLGMQDFSSGWERTLHGVAGGLQLVGTATTFAGSVTRFSSAPRVPGSPPINAVNPELANRLAVSNAARGGGFAIGKVMPNGQIAGMGPGAMYAGEVPLPPALYRGVVSGSVHDIQQATGGGIVPKGGGSSAYLHVNEGMTNSPFTSWTSDIKVAKRFAGTNGKIFSVNPANLPNEVMSSAPFSRLPAEQEFLILGPVTGVKRLH